MIEPGLGSEAAAHSKALSVGAAEWGECLVPPTAVSPALEAAVRKRLGARPGWLPRLGHVPWVAHALSTFATTPVAFANAELCGLVQLIVSQDNSCRYCYGVQRSLLKISGYREESIARLERDFHRADLSAPDRAALEFARRSSRANPRPTGADLADLVRAGVQPQAVTEIAAMASADAFMNRLATLLVLPIETDLEALPDKAIFRLLRPLVAWRMRRAPRAPEPPPHPNDGPFARLVGALGTSPLAGVYRGVIDDLFVSEILPRRTKALLIAVISRALGCVYGEDEARRILERDGFDRAATDEILANLGSRRLDAHESRLVPFARETVRYQPAAIQHRIREVVGELGPDQTLEMVATTAVANALGRLSVILELR